jgi:anthranilate synthase component 1
LFGYISYDAVQLFDNLKLNAQKTESSEIPTIEFSFYKHVLIFNHFNSNLTILEHLRSGETSELSEISQLVDNENIDTHKFELIGSETSNLSDEAFKQIISNGKKHCRRGDVFQIVLSRQFKQKFQGDDFQVYRALRSVNPSPYLFYFDYEKFRLFGSSPESQLKIIGGKAVINPIAGTYKRTGNMLEDEQLAQKLSEDKKENSEHVMLVDLARNDLSRNAKNVFVKTYKEVQYFSHVIHLVSEVVGEFEGDSTKIMADTFPAGTLSGAPKYKAMQLIDKYENQKRGFYGGAVGYIGLNNDINLAIAIRSFVSKNDTLFFQAGAGVVVNSSEESELAEVNNKLSALKKAVELATKMSNNSQILS